MNIIIFIVCARIAFLEVNILISVFLIYLVSVALDILIYAFSFIDKSEMFDMGST